MFHVTCSLSYIYSFFLIPSWHHPHTPFPNQHRNGAFEVNHLLQLCTTHRYPGHDHFSTLTAFITLVQHYLRLYLLRPARFFTQAAKRANHFLVRKQIREGRQVAFTLELWMSPRTRLRRPVSKSPLATENLLEATAGLPTRCVCVGGGARQSISDLSRR